MKEIKISFVDFDIWGKAFNPYGSVLMKVLKRKFNIIKDDDNPDFVFCSCFHHKCLEYDCPRIFLTGEPVFPDFNIYDYALGFNDLTFQDRYLRFPIWLGYEKSWELAKEKHLIPDEELLGRKKFCNFVYSNAGDNSIRKNLFETISEYKLIDSGGGYLNNVGGRCADKLEFQKAYKFSCAFENSSFDGYVTEKIFDAFAAGTIPIYFGTDYISKEVNPKSFINCNDFHSTQELLDCIKKIDSDDATYLKMMHEPVFTEDSCGYKNFVHDDCNKIIDFFTNIFEDNFGVIRRNQTWAGKIYEKPLKEGFLKNLKKRFL